MGKRGRGTGHLYEKYGAYYGRWRTLDGRLPNRLIGPVRTPGGQRRPDPLAGGTCLPQAPGGRGEFAEPEVVWQVTVRGHLIAALSAIPPDGGHDELQRAARAALDELERVDTPAA